MAESLQPPGGASPDVFRRELDNITTNTEKQDPENKIEMEDDPYCLDQWNICDANCCDHFCYCKCISCFCQVRTDIQINANRTVYSGQGWYNGRIPAVPYGELGFQVENGVRALYATLTNSAFPSVPDSVLPESSVQPMAKVDQDYDQTRADAWKSTTSSFVLPGDTSIGDPGMMVRRDHNAAQHLMRCHDGYNSISKGASNAAESVRPHDMTGIIYKKYQERHDANTFFAEGRMFAVLWHESAGRDHGGKHISGQHDFSNSGKIYSHNRRMVVVKGAEHGVSWCVPVNTYQGSGVVKAGCNSSAIRAYSIVYLTAKSLTKTTDDASHTAHKPQPSPAKMSPDDDDDDESYGFRSASTRHINCHTGIGSSQPGAWKAEIKKQNNQREQENRNRAGVDHLVLSDWRSVIARVCGHHSGVIEQEWPELWKDMSASILMTTNSILG